MVAEEIEA